MGNAAGSRGCTPRRRLRGDTGYAWGVGISWSRVSFGGGVSMVAARTAMPGGPLLGEAGQRLGPMFRVARCFVDHRRLQYVEHTVEGLVSQRIQALALGYEDLDGHDRLNRPGLGASRSGRASRCETGRFHLLPTVDWHEIILRMEMETEAGVKAGAGRCC